MPEYRISQCSLSRTVSGASLPMVRLWSNKKSQDQALDSAKVITMEKNLNPILAKLSVSSAGKLSPARKCRMCVSCVGKWIHQRKHANFQNRAWHRCVPYTTDIVD